MKKIRAVLTVLIILVFSATVLFAGEEEEAPAWKFNGEVGVSVHNKYVDETTGELWYDHFVSMQSATIGIEKNKMGFYLQVENYTPSVSGEIPETDFYAGAYFEACDIKVDFGYAHYSLYDKYEADYDAVYGMVEFPETFWKIVPFLECEYRFATKKGEDGESLDGFAYRGGLKREFKITEKVSLNSEISVGGNTGIYGLPAENLAFSREKVEVSVDLTEQLSLKVSAMIQQNLGRQDGIASGTDKPIVGMFLSWTF